MGTLQNDLRHFFKVHRSRTEDIMKLLPQEIRKELEEELSLLEDSVLARVRQDIK